MGAAAAAPAPDLVAAAKAGQPPSFAAVLDARFDPAGRARFDAFRDWAATLDPVERAQYYDQLPPGPSGWGSLLVPMDDLELAADRPIALRLVVPVTADEAASFRAGVDRQAWYASTITSPDAVAARWGQVIAA